MIKIYEDAKGELRWRLLARNGKILADSGEGFIRMSKVKANIRSVSRAFLKPGAEMVLPDSSRETI